MDVNYVQTAMELGGAMAMWGRPPARTRDPAGEVDDGRRRGIGRAGKWPPANRPGTREASGEGVEDVAAALVHGHNALPRTRAMQGLHRDGQLGRAGGIAAGAGAGAGVQRRGGVEAHRGHVHARRTSIADERSKRT